MAGISEAISVPNACGRTEATSIHSNGTSHRAAPATTVR